MSTSKLMSESTAVSKHDLPWLGLLPLLLGLGGCLMVLFVGIREPLQAKNVPATKDMPWTDETALKELAKLVPKPHYTGEVEALHAHYMCERLHSRSISRAYSSTVSLIRYPKPIRDSE